MHIQALGTIKESYVHESGVIAIKFNEGFTSKAIAECTIYNGYAGSRTADPVLKSLLLAAYSSKAKVKVGISGCDGEWLKIIDVRGY